MIEKSSSTHSFPKEPHFFYSLLIYSTWTAIYGLYYVNFDINLAKTSNILNFFIFNEIQLFFFLLLVNQLRNIYFSINLQLYIYPSNYICFFQLYWKICQLYFSQFSYYIHFNFIYFNFVYFIFILYFLFQFYIIFILTIFPNYNFFSIIFQLYFFQYIFFNYIEVFNIYFFNLIFFQTISFLQLD